MSKKLQDTINELTKTNDELLSQYADAGPASAGDLLNTIKSNKEKIDNLKKFLTDSPSEVEDLDRERFNGDAENGASLIQPEDEDIVKLISIFKSAGKKLDYKSTVEDWKEVDKMKSILYERLFADLVHKTTFDITATAKYANVVAGKIYVLETLNQDTKNDILILRDKSNENKWHDRALIASSLSLSLIISKKFDPQKVDCLLDLISDFEKNVWQRALTGLVLSLFVNINKWQKYDRLRIRLEKLQEINEVQEALFNIECLLRNKQYENNFFDKSIFEIEYFKNNPLNYFLPFYKENEILKHCFENSNSADLSYDELLSFVSEVPFLDSYKYSLFLGLCNDTTKKVKLSNEGRRAVLSIINTSLFFYPFHNIISEYYFFFKYYPAKYADEFIDAQTSIYGTKLKDILLNNFNKLILSADNLIRNNNFKAAILDLEKARIVYPKREDVAYNLAICYIEEKKYIEGKKLLEEILANDENDQLVQWKLAQCCRHLEDFKKAKKLLTQLHKNDKKHVGILMELSYLHIEKKEFETSIKYLKIVENIPSKDKMLIQSIGDAYYHSEDYKNALNCHLKVKDLIPIDKFQNALNLACDYEELEEYDLALKYASKALDIKKKNAYAWMLKGWMYFVGQFDISLAKKNLLHSLSFGKMNVTYGNLGHVELTLGNLDTAIKYYKECVIRFEKIEDFIQKYNKDFKHIKKHNISEDVYLKIRDDMVTYWQNNDKIKSEDEVEDKKK